MDILYNDLLIYIVNFIDVESLLSLSQVSIRFNNIYTSNNAWRILIIKYWYPQMYKKYISPEKYFSKYSDKFSYQIYRDFWFTRGRGIKIKITSKTVENNLITIHSYKKVKDFDFDYILLWNSEKYVIYKYLNDFNINYARIYDNNNIEQYDLIDTLNELINFDESKISKLLIEEIRNSNIKKITS